MAPVFRGIRNVFRNPMRSIALLVLLTLSITAVLVMIQIRGSVEQRLTSLRETVGTDIQVSPAGASQGVGQLLADFEIGRLETLEHVVVVDRSLQAQYSGDALESAVDLSAMMGAGGIGSEDNPFGTGRAYIPREMPVIFRGVDSLDRPQIMGGEFNITDGRVFTSEEQTDLIAVVGQTLAEKNSLAVGSLIRLENTDPLEVVGIFSAGNQFGDNAVFLPLETLRSLMGVEDGASSATVYVDSVEYLELVSADITNALGAGRVDVASDLAIVERQSESLDSIRDTSNAGTIAALAGAGGVILLAMFLLVRERSREIGVLKAIGASWGQIVAQFSAESLAFSLMAGVASFAIAVAIAQTVAARFFSPVSSGYSFMGGDSPHGAIMSGGGSGGMGGMGGFFGSRFGGGSLGPLDISVSPDLLLYALGSAVVLGLLGSILAAVYIVRLKPAEVLRHE
jgi:putative ABC transport system permease protein